MTWRVWSLHFEQKLRETARCRKLQFTEVAGGRIDVSFTLTTLPAQPATRHVTCLSPLTPLWAWNASTNFTAIRLSSYWDTAKCLMPILYHWAARIPLSHPPTPFPWGILTPNGISIRSAAAVCAQYTNVTGRPRHADTSHNRPRPHLCTAQRLRTS